MHAHCPRQLRASAVADGDTQVALGRR
jgi:hypothetical protein